MELPRAKNYFNSEPWFNIPRHTQSLTGKKIAILGGGIAGASLAYAFKKKGYSTTIIDQSAKIPNPYSSPEHIIFMPHIIKGESRERRFFLSAWKEFHDLINELDKEKAVSGVKTCGVLELNTDREQNNHKQYSSKLRQVDLKELDANFLNAEEGTEFANIPIDTDSILYKSAGYLFPKTLCGSMLRESEILKNIYVASITRKNEEWLLHDQRNNIILNADLLIVASGIHSNNFSQTKWIQLIEKQGQITYFPENMGTKKLKCVLSANGQLTPAISGMHAIGASYEDPKQGRYANQFNSESQIKNLGKTKQFLGSKKNAWDEGTLVDWIGLRCTTADHLPIVGGIPDYKFYCQEYDDLHHGRHWKEYNSASYHNNLFILTGLGSRGFTTAPLAARILVDQILDDINPSTKEFLNLLHPARFLIRRFKRNT
ncbi:MAG: hypothetical protein CMM25_03085 [Rhodospirillaceae bacterium]|nr:hypothetical protein [Rhodospirillaceae bacterium]